MIGAMKLIQSRWKTTTAWLVLSALGTSIAMAKSPAGIEAVQDSQANQIRAALIRYNSDRELSRHRIDQVFFRLSENDRGYIWKVVAKTGIRELPRAEFKNNRIQLKGSPETLEIRLNRDGGISAKTRDLSLSTSSDQYAEDLLKEIRKIDPSRNSITSRFIDWLLPSAEAGIFTSIIGVMVLGAVFYVLIDDKIEKGMQSWEESKRRKEATATLLRKTEIALDQCEDERGKLTGIRALFNDPRLEDSLNRKVFSRDLQADETALKRALVDRNFCNQGFKNNYNDVSLNPDQWRDYCEGVRALQSCLKELTEKRKEALAKAISEDRQKTVTAPQSAPTSPQAGRKTARSAR